MRRLFALLLLLAPIAVPAQSVILVPRSQCVFHLGDNPAWAAPGLDESNWKPYTQWTPDYHEPRIWIRCHADLASLQAVPEPAIHVSFPGAYELFIDGRQVGGKGNLSNGALVTYRMPAFGIPRAVLHRAATITVRGSLGQWTYNSSRPAQVEVGNLTDLNARRDAQVLANLRAGAGVAVCYLVLSVLGLALLCYWLLDRSRREFLLLGIGCIALSALRLTVFTRFMDTGISAGLLLVWFNVWNLMWPAEVLFFFSIVGRRLPRGLMVVLGIGYAWTLLLFVAGLATFIVPAGVSYPLVHLAFSGYFYASVILVVLFILVLSAVVAFLPLRNLLPRIRVLAVLCLAWVAADVAWLFIELISLVPKFTGLFGRWYSVLAECRGYAVFAVVAALMILLLRDQRRTSEERALLAGEMQAAREIQRMLVPSSIQAIPGFDIQIAFEPMREVGGDFYSSRILPGNRQRILMGDVSGKGAAAAMTGALVIGAAGRRETDSPSALLQHLNFVLCDSRVGGFVTCICVDITPGGSLILANAGSLAPYLNGQELAINSGLPLGVIVESSYTETTHHLEPGDRLTFVSDGVVEATNEKRELFGFDRTQAISSQPASTIAETAKQFGQKDDISVLAITRSPALKAALA